MEAAFIFSTLQQDVNDVLQELSSAVVYIASFISELPANLARLLDDIDNIDDYMMGSNSCITNSTSCITKPEDDIAITIFNDCPSPVQMDVTRLDSDTEDNISLTIFPNSSQQILKEATKPSVVDVEIVTWVQC